MKSVCIGVEEAGKRATKAACPASLGELFPEERPAVGPYSGLIPTDAIDYFRRRFAESLLRLPAEGPARFLDAGSGFGWLSLAIGIADGRFLAVAVDRQRVRLRVLQKLASIFDLGGRVLAVVADLEALPFRPRVFSHAACVETLEHVGEGEAGRLARRRQRQALKELRRVTGRWLLVATPNRWFPWVPHDVALPFAHWMPFWLRGWYARCFHRGDRLARVHFLSVRQVERGLGNPKVKTRFMNFDSPAQWRSIFPLRRPYLPHPGGLVDQRGTVLDWWGRIVFAVLGSKSRYFLHTISTIYDLAKAGGGDGGSEG